MGVDSIPESAAGILLPRRCANFHPSIWGEHFLAYTTCDAKEIITEEDQEHRQLKEEISNMLTGTPELSLEKLELIDTIQRLGIAYHFESEIKTLLLSLYNNYSVCNGKTLYNVALCFRLLRQQGYHASSDVFHQFKNPEGKFKESLVSDIGGLLSLYEAANFMVHGEDVLEEALIFTTTHLRSMDDSKWSGSLIGTQVNQALEQPIHKTLTRLGARQFISIYEENEKHDKVLLYFAKLDFNRLQKLHQKELSELTKWWKELDVARNLPYARDRLVECYFWILGVYFEPQYCIARRITTKVIAMASVIDDTYDVYGTLDELVLFTEGIERWDINAINKLPSYMRHLYPAILDVYCEMETELAKEGKSDLVNYAKDEMKKLVRAYFNEAQWYHNGYVPTIEEYMNLALVSGGYMMISTTSLVGMGNLTTEAGFEWVTSEPLIVRAASTICRLMDDMAGHEDEQERGDVASAVECYMNQYGVSKKEARYVFEKMVKHAWKDINKEWLNPAAVPLPLLERIVNLARVINLLYKDEDSYTHSSTKVKEMIISVLVDPIPLSNM